MRQKRCRFYPVDPKRSITRCALVTFYFSWRRRPLDKIPGVFSNEPLRAEVIRQKGSAKTLKDKMLAEMLEQMVSVIQSDSQRNEFVFARNL